MPQVYLKTEFIRYSPHEAELPKTTKYCPDVCSSVEWASSHAPKGCRFNSQSEHMRGLWARAPCRRCVGGNQLMIRFHINVLFLSLFLRPSLSPSFLKINESIYFFKNYKILTQFCGWKMFLSMHLCMNWQLTYAWNLTLILFKKIFFLLITERKGEGER